MLRFCCFLLMNVECRLPNEVNVQWPLMVLINMISEGLNQWLLEEGHWAIVLSDFPSLSFTSSLEDGGCEVVCLFQTWRSSQSFNEKWLWETTWI